MIAAREDLEIARETRLVIRAETDRPAHCAA